MSIETIVVAFPKLNKNNRLSENKREVLRDYNVERCKIEKVIELSKKDFDKVANTLLTSREDLWENIGGEFSNAPEFEGKEFDEIINDPYLWQIWLKTCATFVIEVKDKESDRKFYVNTEGYSYARYVGHILDENGKILYS